MKHHSKRWCVAMLASMSLAATGTLAGHATADPDQVADRPGSTSSDQSVVFGQGHRPEDAGVMLRTAAVSGTVLAGDFDGDGVADRAVLSTEFHDGEAKGDATCWVDFELSGALGHASQGVLMKFVDSRDAYNQGACLYSAVTDFNGDGAQGVTFFEENGQSHWQSDSDMAPREVNIGGIQVFDDLMKVGWERELSFADVSGDGKTDIIAATAFHPDWGTEFEVMVTPDNGVPTGEPLSVSGNGIYQTTGNVDPTHSGAQIIYRGIPETLDPVQGEGVPKKWCMVNAMYPVSGDRRAIIAPVGEYLCPADDIEVGVHNGKPAVAVGWLNYQDGRLRIDDIGDFATIHQADANGVFHQVTDYPAPVARRDRVKLTTGSHMSGCVPVLDNDLNTLGARVRIISEPSRGAAEVKERHQQCIDYTWQHSGGGTDELEYVVEGPGGVSAPQRLIIEAEGEMPPAPVAHDDAFTLDPVSSYNNECLQVQENDDNAMFSTINIVTEPEHAFLDVRRQRDGSACVFYDRLGFGTEPDSFSYTLTHMGRTSAPATVAITMNEDLPAPQAVNDTISWAYSEAAPGEFYLLDNDKHVHGAKVEIIKPPQHGTIKQPYRVDGKYEYVPNVAVVESDSFEYEITTGGGTSRATVTLTRVGEMPAAPVAVDDRIEVEPWRQGSRYAIGLDLLENDEVTALGAVNIVSQPSIGSITNGSNGVNYLVPDGPFDEVKETSFTYSLSNVAGTSAEATVTLVLLPKPDLPQPIAADDRIILAYGGNEQGCIPVLGNDTHVIGGKGTQPQRSDVVIVSQAKIGHVFVGDAGQDDRCITYLRAPGAVGDDEFTYKVVTGFGESNVARVRVVMQGTPPAARAALFF